MAVANSADERDKLRLLDDLSTLLRVPRNPGDSKLTQGCSDANTGRPGTVKTQVMTQRRREPSPILPQPHILTSTRTLHTQSGANRAEREVIDPRMYLNEAELALLSAQRSPDLPDGSNAISRAHANPRAKRETTQSSFWIRESSEDQLAEWLQRKERERCEKKRQEVQKQREEMREQEAKAMQQRERKELASVAYESWLRKKRVYLQEEKRGNLRTTQLTRTHQHTAASCRSRTECQHE